MTGRHGVDRSPDMDPAFFIPAECRLLASGWSADRAAARLHDYSLMLHDAGVEYGPATTAELSVLDGMIREHITGLEEWSSTRSDAGVAIARQGGQVIGGVVSHVMAFGDDMVVHLQHLVVSPEWRRRGVGTVLLGLTPQIVERAAGEGADRDAVFYGQCAPGSATWLHRSGYVVLQPGQPIVLCDQMIAVPDDAAQRCWFARRAGSRSVFGSAS
ncbi:GNAT family N-acetyltransferase [Microlunatus sp. Y2014]|uniref:GNAT family N-acetyltransferase n=1 Tax=Microlunatus sp. Y2014 TaxID=3418488 RepID=UPI003DA7621D